MSPDDSADNSYSCVCSRNGRNSEIKHCAMNNYLHLISIQNYLAPPESCLNFTQFIKVTSFWFLSFKSLHAIPASLQGKLLVLRS